MQSGIYVQLVLTGYTLELIRVNDIVRRMTLGVMSSEEHQGHRQISDHATMDKLIIEVAKFVTHLERGNLPAEIAEQLPNILRIGQYYSQVAELAQLVSRSQVETRPLADAELEQMLNLYKSRVVELISSTDLNDSTFSYEICDTLYVETENTYQDLKAAILHAGVIKRLDLTNMTNTLEYLSHIRRQLSQHMKGVHGLADLRRQLKAPKVSIDTPVEATEE